MVTGFPGDFLKNESTRPSTTRSELATTAAPTTSRVLMTSPKTKYPNKIEVTGMRSVTNMTFDAPDRTRIWKKMI